MAIMLIKLQELARNLPESAVVESTSVAGPGFLNVVLSTLWIEQVWMTPWFPMTSILRSFSFSSLIRKVGRHESVSAM